MMLRIVVSPLLFSSFEHGHDDRKEEGLVEKVLVPYRKASMEVCKACAASGIHDNQARSSRRIASRHFILYMQRL